MKPVSNRLKLLGLAVLAVIFLTGNAYANITIMAMGDSITRGGHGSPSGRYRAELANALTDRNIEFEFVGEFSDAAGRHQGVSGASIDTMTLSYGASVSQHQPDIVLVLAGTNNHFNPSVKSEFVQRYTDLLNMIHANAPNARVIMSTVPKFAYDRPNTAFWTEAFVDNRNAVTFPTMNDAIYEVAEERDWVTVVDLFSVVDIENDYAVDAVHPNLYGQQKLAALFEQEIVETTTIMGDVNQDGYVSFLDIASFVDILMENGYLEEADIYQDGLVNFLDIGPFIDLLN